jgi:biofilm PGA synthesis N-glycosyltransferase PgaC
MIFFILLSIFVLLSLNLLIILPIIKLNYVDKSINIDLGISIIISAKNEEANITSLIQHLKKPDYDSDKFEIILVDDDSSDDTFRLMKELTGLIQNCKVLTTKFSVSKGKREALSVGIKNAIYPYILITDADCRPGNNWLKSYSMKFEQGYDMLFGIAPFYQRLNLVNNISCFENLRSSILAFSMTSLGLPYTATARNFGFTKRAFESLGGYSKTKETKSGDDDLLLREAVKHKLKIGIVTRPDSFVFSETKKTFSEYLQQKARHTQTSFHYLKKHQLILGFWHLLNLFFLLSPLMMFVNPLIGLLFPSKMIIDLLVVKSTQKKFSYKFSVIKIFYLQIFYEIFLMIHFLNARSTDIKWK